MVFHHEHHHLELHNALQGKMNKLYIFQAAMTFAKSLIGIFVPVYLYKLGFSFVEILLYGLGFSLVYLILIPVSVKILKHIGFKYTLLSSIPIYLMHIISLNFLTESILFYHIAWFTFGTYVSLFWPAMHSEIALSGSIKHRSSQMGTLQIISTIFATIAPLIGGFVLYLYGIFPLIFFSIFFVLLGILPLLFSKDIVLKKYDFNYADYFRLIRDKRYKFSKMPFSFEGIENTLSLHIWPILVFIFLSGNFLLLGSLFSFMSLISVVLIVFIKSYLDKTSKSSVLVFISKLLSVNWFLRIFVILFGSIFIYFVDVVGKLLFSVFSLSYVSIFYNNAQKTLFMDYIILRETYLHSFKILFIITLISVFIIFGENKYTFSFAIMSGLITPIALSHFNEE